MPTRWYVCDVIGSGTRTDPYRPRLVDQFPAGRTPKSWTAVLPAGASWCLVVVDAAADAHAALAGDARNLVLGDGAAAEGGLDTALPAAARTPIRAVLAAKGLSAAALARVDASGDRRALVRAVGESLAPGFDEHQIRTAAG